MKTQVVPADSPTAIPHALEVLQAGGLVAFPTDTVYGVGALAFDGSAVTSIYVAKDRPAEKAIPVLLGDGEELGQVAAHVTEIARRLAASFWPGPVTLVLPKKPTLPEAVSSLPTVGVRVPDHEAARALLRVAGPMAVTSANISSQASPSTAQEVSDQLGGRIALILDGGRTPGGVPSTLVNCSGSKPAILRIGPVSLEEIRSALS